MTPQHEGRKRSSGKGAIDFSDAKRTATTCLRVDAPAFKPASPPKTNPWTNFKPRTCSEPLITAPNDPTLPPSPPSELPTSDPYRPPLQSWAKKEGIGDTVEEDLKPTVTKPESRSGDASAQEASTTPGSVETPEGHEEIANPESQADPAGKACPEETSIGATPSPNPWFTTSNPFSRRAKVKSEPVETSDPPLLPISEMENPPLPPISETESPCDPLKRTAPSSTSKSTVQGSPLKNEITLADDETFSEETLQAVPSLSNNPGSPREILKNSRPPSRDSTHSLTSADTARRTARSGSTGSEDSRRAMVAAALQGDEYPWANHIAADIHVTARDWGMWVHRSVVEHKSLYLKELLPPPAPVSTHIALRLDCAPEGLAHCIMWMYTGRIENIKATPPYDTGHLPRCVLMYSCALYLRIEGMLLMILSIVEQTARELEDAIRHHRHNRGRGDMLSWIGFTEDHLLDALELIYDQPSQELMKPMRMAMAAVLDSSLLWLLQRPSFKQRIEGEAWAVQIERFLGDITEYRSLKQASANGSVIPDNQVIFQLLQHQDLVYKNNLVL